MDTLIFSYFKGRGDGLHLATSDDGYHWKTINGDKPILYPKAGYEKIMRDPCLVFGHDQQFHLVWTCGWSEPGIGYASSPDLLTWSEQEFLPVMVHESKTKNCWAPEIFYYEKDDCYIIYWSSTVEGRFPETQLYGDEGHNHRLYFVTTKDFKSFSETRLLYDGGFNVIDGNIVKADNGFLLFMKNETLIPPQKNIRMAFGDSPYTFGDASEALTPNHYWAEGPTGIQIREEWIVYFDKYKINEIGAIRSVDLQTWEDISSQIKFPQGAQHGFVSRIPGHTVDKLRQHFSKQLLASS